MPPASRDKPTLPRDRYPANGISIFQSHLLYRSTGRVPQIPKGLEALAQTPLTGTQCCSLGEIPSVFGEHMWLCAIHKTYLIKWADLPPPHTSD
jgi:hypothetical protein